MAIQYTRVEFPAVEDMTPEMKARYDGSIRRFGAPTGPRLPFHHTPEIWEAWGNFYNVIEKTSGLPADLWELAILVVARHWGSHFEWWAHEQKALDAGLSSDVLEAIKSGGEPNLASEGQIAVYRFVRELLRDRTMRTETYETLRSIIGQKQLIELAALIGHYNNVAMSLTIFDVQLPPGVDVELPAVIA